MYRILLVDDNQENCTLIESYLRRSKEYEVTTVYDAASAFKATRKQAFDLILLDIMLPDLDGIELCVRLRKTLFCPIIFISCLDDEETIVRAFRMGGDDYLTKPFRGAMLEAHIEAIRRRMQTVYHAPTGIYTIGDQTLHTDEHVLRRGEETTYLTHHVVGSWHMQFHEPSTCEIDRDENHEGCDHSLQLCDAGKAPDAVVEPAAVKDHQSRDDPEWHGPDISV